MCNAGRSTSRGQGSKGQAGAPRAAPRPSGQAGMSFFFFSAPTWCIFHMQSACMWTICYPDPKEMSRRQSGPSPEGLGSPRSIVGTEGKGEQLDDSVNSCTERPKFPNRCDQQQLDTSLWDSILLPTSPSFHWGLNICHSNPPREPGRGRRKERSLKSQVRVKKEREKESDVHNPSAKGNLWVYTAKTAQQWVQVWTSQSRQRTHHRQHHGAEELCSLSAPNMTLMPKVHWPRQKAELVISLGLHINPSSENLTFSQGLKYSSCLISEMFTLQNTVMHRWRDSCSHISCGNWFLWDLLPVGLILLQIFCKRNLPDSSAQHFADTMLKGTGIMNFMPEGY